MRLPEAANTREYYAALAPQPPRFDAASGSLCCDLCIVGGGITGLAAALHAAEAGLDVIVLERDRLAGVASGRNAGFMTPYVDFDPSGVERALGPGRAGAYWALAHEAVHDLETVVHRHDIACQLRRGMLMAAGNARDLDRLGDGLERFTRDFGMRGGRLVDRAQLERMVRGPGYAGAVLHEGLATVDPLRLCYGLAEAARNAGARIHESSTVLRYEEATDTVVVELAGGARVDCGHLLLAANAQVSDLVPALARRFLALHASIIATKPLTPAQIEAALPARPAVLEAQAPTSCFYRLCPDNRLLFGGSSLAVGSDGRHAAPLLRRRLRQLFPSLADAGVEYVWGGWFGMTAYGDVPDVGRISARTHYAQAIPVVWAQLHGRLLAECLCGRPQRYDVLADIDLPLGPRGAVLSRLLWRLGNIAAGVRAALLGDGGGVRTANPTCP